MRALAERGELTVTDLVKNLAGLFITELVHFLALQRRQSVQSAPGKLRSHP